MSFESAVRANQLALATMQPHLGEIVVLLKDVRGDVASGLAELTEKYGFEQKYSIHKHRELMYQLDDAIKATEKQLPLVAKSALQKSTAKTAQQSIANLQQMVDEGAKKFGGVVSNLRIPLAKALNTVEDSLARRHASSAERYAGSVGQRVRREMAIGAIKGESIGQTAKRLLKIPQAFSLEKDADLVAPSMAQKQFFRNKADAERLLITEQSHAYNQAQIASLGELDKEDPGWKKMWDATIDKRTCAACRAMHREIVAWNALFSCGLQGPPLHPYCRCVIVPVRDGWSLF